MSNTERNLEIVKLRNSGETLKYIAKRYGISVTSVRNITRHHVWVESERKRIAAYAQTSKFLPIENLSARTRNALFFEGFDTPEKIYRLLTTNTEDKIYKIPNIGRKSYSELWQWVESHPKPIPMPEQPA